MNIQMTSLEIHEYSFRVASTLLRKTSNLWNKKLSYYTTHFGKIWNCTFIHWHWKCREISANVVISNSKAWKRSFLCSWWIIVQADIPPLTRLLRTQKSNYKLSCQKLRKYFIYHNLFVDFFAPDTNFNLIADKRLFIQVHPISSAKYFSLYTS